MENKYKNILENSLKETSDFQKVGRAVVSLRSSLFKAIQDGKKLAATDKNLKSQMKKLEKDIEKMIVNIEDI